MHRSSARLLSPTLIFLFQRQFWPETSQSFPKRSNNGEFVRWRPCWVRGRQCCRFLTGDAAVWLGWAWWWETSMKACCLSQWRGTCRAGEGQPSPCSRLDLGGEGPAIALLALEDPPDLAMQLFPGGMLDMRSPWRGRLRGARVPRHARDMLGGRWPPVLASQAPPVPGRYFPCTSFSQPWLEELVLSSICLSRGEGGCPATAPYLSHSPGLAFQPHAPPQKKQGEAAPVLGRSVRVLPGGTSPRFGPVPPASSPG